MRLACATAVLLLLATCRHQVRSSSESSQVSMGADTVLTGVIRIAGADPTSQVTLLLRDRTSRALTGSLTSELAQLDGATVSVKGTPVTTPAPVSNGIRVRAYEIIEVAGARPVVGILKQNPEAYFVDSTRLAIVPPELRNLGGSKVWVVGRPSPDGLVVTAYGVLGASASHR